MKKRWMAMLAALFMACALLACNNQTEIQSTAAEVPTRLYRAVSAVYEGDLYRAEDVFKESLSFELQPNGKGTFGIDADSDSVQWTLDGETITITDGDVTMTGILRDGVLTFADFLGLGADAAFVCDALGGSAAETVYQALRDAEARREIEAHPTPEPIKYDTSWWVGKWYGWLVITDGSGQYAELVDVAKDEVAEITAEGETGRIVLWDYDALPDQPTADVSILFGEGTSAAGSAVSLDGVFSGCPIGYRSWVIDPADSRVTAFDKMIEISGTAYDAEGQFLSYSCYLRPWGMDWKDVRASIPSADMPYQDMMPVHYDDWYVYEAGFSARPTEEPQSVDDGESSDMVEATVGTKTE